MKSGLGRAFVVGAMVLGMLAAIPARAESIKIGISKLLSYPAVPIAIARGYFKEQGLDAEMVYFDSAQPIAVGVASGSVDFGVAGVSAGFFALAGQGQLRLIASSGLELPGFYNLGYLVSNKAYDAGLKSLKDAPGHSLAVTQVGTALHYSLGLLAEKYGFDIKTVAVRPLQSNSNVIAALTGGQVDMGIMPATPTLGPIAHGDFKRLGWVSDVAPGSTGSLVFTSTKSANERGDVVKRFLIAYRKAAHDFHEAFATSDDQRKDGPTAPAVLAILADFTGVPAEKIDPAMPYVDAQGRFSAADIAHQVAWYQSQGMLKADIKAEDLIDMRYVIALPKPKG
jgi:NitT/TauT family transport system substrate-binding protein